jgi:succinyl-CoA synthetase beta subunit
MQKLDVGVPVVVRLSGTNVELGRKILAESDIDLITADTLAEAAELAVEAARVHQGNSQ